MLVWAVFFPIRLLVLKPNMGFFEFLIFPWYSLTSIEHFFFRKMKSCRSKGSIFAWRWSLMRSFLWRTTTRSYLSKIIAIVSDRELEKHWIFLKLKNVNGLTELKTSWRRCYFKWTRERKRKLKRKIKESLFWTTYL